MSCQKMADLTQSADKFCFGLIRDENEIRVYGFLFVHVLVLYQPPCWEGELLLFLPQPPDGELFAPRRGHIRELENACRRNIVAARVSCLEGVAAVAGASAQYTFVLPPESPQPR
jgi:hypothetical protein